MRKLKIFRHLCLLVLWSYGDSNPRGMTSQEQRRRSTSILPIYQRVQGSANLCIMVELRGFEPARHALARTTPAIHFNYLNLSMSTGFCKTSVLWWSYGDSNPRGMTSQEQRRRTTSIISICQ